MPSAKPACKHFDLQVEVSPHAAEVGFIRPPLEKRIAATTRSGRVSKTKTADSVDGSEGPSPFVFPGPLVLPNDALAYDPKEPPQSMRSWTQEKVRNRFVRNRKTLYVMPFPSIPDQLSFMKKWAIPSPPSRNKAKVIGKIPAPKTEDIIDYLAAFYHPLPVKPFSSTVAFVPWNEDAATTPDQVGLQIGDEGITGVRTRPCPDGVFPRQLNLNDALDAVLEALPEDAYAVVLLLEQDTYEDDDDDYCCGRAYGSSRISVVSQARYHPALDARPEGGGAVDSEHMWPASHCKAYVRALLRVEGGNDGEAIDVDMEVGETPMGAAIHAAVKAGSPAKNLHGLWLSRLVRTASHELGHCLCLGHCSYYACVMQSSASTAEDVRQPPYLCPVCLAKVTAGLMDVTPRTSAKELQVQRYKALMGFCERWTDVSMFAGYRAWLGKRAELLESQNC